MHTIIFRASANLDKRHYKQIMAQGEAGGLFIKTPLIRSEQLSSKLGATVWLKLENLQNTFSFKARGIGNLCKQVIK